MHELLKKRSLERYLEGHPKTIPDRTTIINLLKPWVAFAASKSTIGEENVDLLFLDTFFVKILGYTMPPGDSFSLVPKKALETLDTPDFRLGHFVDEGRKLLGNTIAVGELKAHQKDLDKVDPSYGESPVQQAFRYGRRSGIDVVWVLISNMTEIRLYRVNNELHYQSFKIDGFLDEDELTDEFWNFYYILRKETLLEPIRSNPIASMITASMEQRVKLTDAFYKYYRLMLSDVFSELIEQYSSDAETTEGKEALAQAAQQFLHRGLMICFMSDHPSRLLKQNLLDEWIRKAEEYEIIGNKIYPSLKALFRQMDSGNPAKGIFGYDGGLFKENKHLDNSEFELPDALFTKEYKMNGKKMIGVYGFRGIDFYNELSPHLLGRLFENSIADQEEIFRRIASGTSADELVNLQGEFGIVYTREVLAKFASKSALESIFNDIKRELLQEKGVTEIDKLGSEEVRIVFWKAYLDKLMNLKVVDLSVGSGAFLVECYQVLKQEAERAFKLSKPDTPVLLEDYFGLSAEILDRCFFGKDILPGAVAVAELALWLASAQKDVKLTNFQDNFLVGDTLGVPGHFPKVEEGEAYQKFDLVIGNPPWGAEVSSASLELFKSNFRNAQDVDKMDTFELFLHVGSRYLKENGRLCYILPHSILYPEKRRTRAFLLENFTIERWHYLGAEWFGKDIRMNTTVLQFKNVSPQDDSKFCSMTLAGAQRKQAITGETSLEQLEDLLAFPIPQERCNKLPDFEVELFRYVDDDLIMRKMETVSYGLGEICFRTRGVELNKAGVVIQCPSCFKWDAPPRAVKGVPKKKWKKRCSHCGHEYQFRNALSRRNIVTESESSNTVPYVDGDGIDKRYSPPSYKRIEIGLDGINYKDIENYKPPKILIRQAGMGLIATYDESGALCPQTVYIYRPSNLPAIYPDGNELEEKWSAIISPKFLLGIIHSRALSYYLLKRYGEIDNAQAFSKVTHTKLAVLPIPVKEWSTENWQRRHHRIVELVDEMLKGEPIGGTVDYELENLICELYGLNGKERAHIMSQFGLVEYHRAIKELFPERPPRPEIVSPLKMIATIEDFQS